VTVGADVEYRWHADDVPGELRVRQVYGWLLDQHGRCLVQVHADGVTNLPGGTPEPEDADQVATLVREAMEENQVAVGETAYLGYQEVRRPRAEPYAQVRMVGLITAFHPRRPDPDGGDLYARYMAPLAEAARMLAWGDSGEAQAAAVLRVATTRWGLPVHAPLAAPGFMD
jgi:hypothetical protein